jgi:hypothetical protein
LEPFEELLDFAHRPRHAEEPLLNQHMRLADVPALLGGCERERWVCGCGRAVGAGASGASKQAAAVEGALVPGAWVTSRQ